MVLKVLLEWVENEDPDMTKGYIYAGVIAFTILMRSYTGLLADYYIENASAIIRNVVRVIFALRILGHHFEKSFECGAWGAEVY